LLIFWGVELCRALKQFIPLVQSSNPNLIQIEGAMILMQEISATELKEKLDRGQDVQLIDVREADEVAIARIPNAVHILLAQVVNRMEEIDPNRETVVHCKGGVRSARAIEALQRSGFKGELTNLRGGITAWSNEVDPTVPKY
jgi:adenylyltransferase/sulfurtransferase